MNALLANTNNGVRPEVIYIGRQLPAEVLNSLSSIASIIQAPDCSQALKAARLNVIDAIILNVDDSGLEGIKFVEDRTNHPMLYDVPCLLAGKTNLNKIQLELAFDDFYEGELESPLFIKRIQNFIRLSSRLRLLGDRSTDQASLALMAYYDQVTGLPNRQFFEIHLNKIHHQAYFHNVPFSLYYIDLDQFKAINDTLGHKMGDLLLQNVAQEIKTSVRRQDFIARVGGDEFMVILKDIDHGVILKSIAQRILKAIEKTKPQEVDFNITASIGCAIYPIHGDNPQDLNDIADKAMYHAKKNGGNQFHMP